MESTLHRVLRWGPLGLLVLVPLLVYYGTFYHNEIKDLVMVGVVALTSLGWLWVSIVEERIQVRVTLTRVVLSANVLVWVVTLLTSAQPEAGLFPLSVRLAGVGLLLLTPALLGGMSDIKLAVTLLLGTGAVMSCYGILQFLNLDPFFSTAGMEGHFRVRSTAGHPNFFVTFLSVCIALNIAGFWLFGRSKRTRILLGVGLVLALVAAVGTMSRAGWAALVLAQGTLAVLLVVGLRSDRGDRASSKALSKVVLAVLGAVVLAGVVSAAVLAATRLDPAERARVTSLSGSTLDKRLLVYSAGLNMAADAPLLGHGLGTFATYLPEYRSPDLTRYYPRNDYHVQHATSEPLEVMAESGGLGLLVWLALGALFVLRPIWAMLKERDVETKAFFAAIAAAMLGIVAHSFLEQLLRHQPMHYIYWALPGLALAAEKAAGIEARAWRVLDLKNWPARLGISAVVGMTFGLVFAYVLTDFVANVHVGRGRRAILNRDMATADRAFRDALAIQKSNLAARYQLAYTQWKQGHLDRARTLYQGVLARSPSYFDVNHNLARVLYEQGKFDQARKHVARAMKLNPHHVPSFDLAVTLAIQRKDFGRAEELAREIASRAGHNEVAHLTLARTLLAEGQTAKARKLLTDVQKRFPQSKEIRRLLRSLNN